MSERIGKKAREREERTRAAQERDARVVAGLKVTRPVSRWGDVSPLTFVECGPDDVDAHRHNLGVLHRWAFMAAGFTPNGLARQPPRGRHAATTVALMALSMVR